MRLLTDDEVKKASHLRLIVNICTIVLILGVVFAVTGFLRTGLEDAASTVTYAEAADIVVDKQTHEINFVYLHEAGCISNSWIYVPDTNIDYPLVQGPDNDYYMYKDAYGNDNSAGAIFINFANSKNLTDPKTVIFGHNMLDNSMFTDLHKYNNDEWGSKHQDMYVYMENGDVKKYRALCYLYTDPSNEAIYIVSKSEDPAIVARTLIGQADVVYNDYSGGLLVCLSTCKYHDFRSVVVFEEISSSKASEDDPHVGSSVSDNEDVQAEDEANTVEGDQTDNTQPDDGAGLESSQGGL